MSVCCDSVEAALRQGDGYVKIDTMDGNELLFSEYYACPICGFSVPELEPRLFSFNAPQGACSAVMGLACVWRLTLIWSYQMGRRRSVRVRLCRGIQALQPIIQLFRAGHDGF